MTLVRWNPTRDLATMEIDRLNSMFGDFFDLPAHRSWVPAVDVYETDSHYGYSVDWQPRVNSYDQGTLVIDIVDTKTNKVVWRGWAQDTMDGVIDNQQRLEKQVDEGVTKMMLMLPNGGSGLSTGVR